MKISKKSIKNKKIEFVFKGKNYVSNLRAEAKKFGLLKAGYKLISTNGKKSTFELINKSNDYPRLTNDGNN